MASLITGLLLGIRRWRRRSTGSAQPADGLDEEPAQDTLPERDDNRGSDDASQPTSTELVDLNGKSEAEEHLPSSGGRGRHSTESCAASADPSEAGNETRTLAKL